MIFSPPLIRHCHGFSDAATSYDAVFRHVVCFSAIFFRRHAIILLFRADGVVVYLRHVRLRVLRRR